ncbi:MAG TPA: zf-HC2 domain-containing protein [Gemmatimonadaceae bacterium]|nr:zf-HC2 domain-containing protein [Gemmatimonadaceae bacterium]
MTTFNLTCEAVETLLHEYVDETLDPWLRESVEEHLSGCAGCTRFARNLRNVTREAAALPGLLPESDVWRRVAGRIGAPNVEPEDARERLVETKPAEPVVVAQATERVVTRTVEPVADMQITDPVIPAAHVPIFLTEREVVGKEPPAARAEAAAPAGHLSFVTAEPVALADIPLEPVPTAPLPTVPLTQPRRSRREIPWTGGHIAVAAAAVVLVTAVTTSFLTVRWLGPSRTPSVASDTRAPGRSSSEKTPGNRGSGPGKVRAGESGTVAGLGTVGGAARGARTSPRDQVALDSTASAPLGPPAQLASALTVPPPAHDTIGSPEDVVYNKEIKALKKIVRRQRADLDASTVSEIEQNLETLDSAIAQIRAALQKDPSSPLLSGQASRTLEMKVELLRRAAMLSSST